LRRAGAVTSRRRPDRAAAFDIVGADQQL